MKDCMERIHIDLMTLEEEEVNGPNFKALEVEHILPLCADLQKRHYGGQT